MSDLPAPTDEVRRYLGALGKKGAASLHDGTTFEERQARTAAARAARAAKPTTKERLAALAAELESLRPLADEVPALRAEVADLRQRVAA